MTLQLRLVAHSEIGLVRKNNQDSGYASPTLMIVADGMGGAAAGDLASTIAIAELKKADGPHQGEEMLEVLAGAVQRANDRMADLIADDHGLDGMGTTVCGALFDGTTLGVVHIGDSRGYLRRDGELDRLTHDHSWVQTLVDEGRITEEESLYHPHRSLILKVLNGQPVHEPDLFLVDVQAGDRLMFCSDGLCGLVTDATIDALMAEPDLNHALSDLTEAAHAGGGLDNITIILADVIDTDAEAAADAAAQPGASSSYITTPTVVGAAATRAIPTAAARPLVSLDTEVGDDPVTDAKGNPIPKAPAPTAAPGRLVAANAEAPRHTPQRRKGRRKTGLVVGIVALVLAVLGGGWGTYAYAQTRFYVGAAASPAGAEVAIYRGVKGELAGLPLSRLIETSGIAVTDLPVSWAQQVKDTIPVRDGGLDAARETVAQLKVKSEKCVQQRKDRAAATQSPSPTPTPAASVTPASPGSSGGTPPTSMPQTTPGQDSGSPGAGSSVSSGSGSQGSGPTGSSTSAPGSGSAGTGTGTGTTTPALTSAPSTSQPSAPPAPEEC